MKRGSSPATEYMTAVLTEYRLLNKKRKVLHENLQRWKKRITLAAEKGEKELETAAQRKAQEIEEDLAALTMEKNNLERELETAKKDIRNNRPLHYQGADPEKLLHRLQTAAGETDELPRKIDALSIEKELQELKEKQKP